MTTPAETAPRYVASRSGGGARLPRIDELVGRREPEPKPPESTPMATKRKIHTVEEREAILAQIGKGKSDQQVADDNGISVGTIYVWKGKKRGKKASKKKRRAGKKKRSAVRLEQVQSDTPKAEPTLESALKEIDSAARTIRAIRAAYKQVFG